MLRPELMHQVSIIVAKDELPNLLSYAGREQLIHLITIEDEHLPPGATPFEATGLLSKSATIRNRISALAAALQAPDVQPEKIEAPIHNIDELALFLDQETSKLEGSVRQLEEAQGKLLTDKERTSELSRFLSGLEAVGMPLGTIGSSEFLVTLAGECAKESTVSIQTDLDELTYGNLIFVITHSADKTQTFLAIFPRAFEDDAKQAATALGSRVEEPWADLPPDPKEAKKFADARLANINDAEEELDHQRDVLRKENGPILKTLEYLTEILEGRSRAVSNSSTTESTFMLRGWVAEKSVQRLAEGASQACNGLVSVLRENVQDGRKVAHSTSIGNGVEAKGHQTPPTLVRVPGWATPLQSVIDNFGIPSYNETNPLVFMILTFPLIYGLMFGDFGEGPLFLVLGLFLLWLKRKKVKIFEIGQLFVNGAELIVMLGIGITIFGFLFGDFFGFESQAIFGLRPFFNPNEGAFAATPDISHLLIYMSVILLFGVGHYLSGLAISIYNKVRNHEIRHAFYGPISWAWFYIIFIYLASQVVISGYKFGVLLQNPTLLVLLFIPMGIMAVKEGPLHFFEVFISAGSNTLSYLRIWALNLADFAIKFAFFTSFGIAGAIAGNLLVMILEGLIVFVQTLRLHWVEWFSKFYEGSGLSFAPYREPTSWTV
ncbi:MAG TPA: V-type ATPase 116kDa subunit family protein [Candidatus Bathyarchaeia archaeon]|nr:V-type ATPase 116kDa subunit family protein [Candidatus Bathyarchaeia archaeon]